jgi:hypothetical protein
LNFYRQKASTTTFTARSNDAASVKIVAWA